MHLATRVILRAWPKCDCSCRSVVIRLRDFRNLIKLRRLWMVYDAFVNAVLFAPTNQLTFRHQISVARDAVRLGNSMLVAPQNTGFALLAREL